MPVAPRGILFDKDGTLLDYHRTWMPANHAVAAHLSRGDDALKHRLMVMGGWDPSTDRVGAGTVLAAGDFDDIARLWAPHLPDGAPATVDALVAFMDEAFPAHMEPTPVCDLPALLDGLAARDLALGVATADSANGLRQSLAPFDILDRFVFAVGFDSGHGRKPAPGMVHGFCAAAGLEARDVWVVGDNRHDMEMAAAGGAVGIGVLTGTSDADDLRAAGAAEVLTSIAELSGLL